jgi:hypothetical protein
MSSSIPVSHPESPEFWEGIGKRIVEVFREAVAQGKEDVVVCCHQLQGTISAFDRATALQIMSLGWEGEFDLRSAMSESAMTETFYGFWLLIRDHDTWVALPLGWPRRTRPPRGRRREGGRRTSSTRPSAPMRAGTRPSSP